MKKIYFFGLFLLLLNSEICCLYAQTGWYNTFVYNPNVITTMITRDSSNYFCFSMNSMFYTKTTDGGTSWSHHKLCDSAIDIRGGYFLNSFTGWVVGYNEMGGYYGIIYKTTDGGLNWIRQNCNPSQIICWSVFFINENTGWVSGQSPTSASVLKTTNGGTSWILNNFGSIGIMRNLYFLNSNTGWLTGDHSYIGKTTNGGLNWNNIATNTPMSNKLLVDFYYLDSTNYYASALGYYPDPNGYIFRTSNAGMNWTQQYTYITGQDKYFYGIQFTNNFTGFAWGGTNSLIKTTNSGNNWFNLNQNSTLSNFSMYIKTDNELFIAGGNSSSSVGPNNMVIRSTNAGTNWNVNISNPTVSFSKILFTDEFTGFASMDPGKIFKTTNAGINWNICYQNTSGNTTINSIDFVSNSLGCAVGGISNTATHVIRTTNGGTNWQNIDVPVIGSINSVKFLDSNIMIAVCPTYCLKSLNSGLNWILCTLPASQYASVFTDISFINNNTGYILGYEYHAGSPYSGYYYVANIFKTTNAGDNWSTIISMNTGYEVCTRFQMLGNGIGYLIKSNYGYYKTSDSGSSWQSISINNWVKPVSIQMLNQTTGWIGFSSGFYGTGVYKTINGGISWFQQFNENNKTPRSFFVFDENNVWFAGNGNSIYKTTNGGGVIGISNINNSIPKYTSLSQNYPNPFNPVTNIKFDIPQRSNVKISIFDILGKEISVLVNEVLNSGTFEVNWDASNYPSGVYFYKLVTDGFSESKKMILLK